MKVLYMRGTARLTDDELDKYQNYRFENALMFSGVARGVTEATVAGDYPDVLEALKEADVKIRRTTLSCDKVEKAEKPQPVKVEPVAE